MSSGSHPARGGKPHTGPSLDFLPALPRFSAVRGPLSRTGYGRMDTVVQVVASQRQRLPFNKEFRARRARLNLRHWEEVACTWSDGSLAVQAPTRTASAFGCLQALRRGMDLAGVRPGMRVALDLRQASRLRKLSRLATYASLVHVARMPSYERDEVAALPVTVSLHGYTGDREVRTGIAAAEANILCRQLCLMPANILDATRLVGVAQEAATLHGLDCEHLDTKKLRKMGAGLFLAVTGPTERGGLVRVSYRCGRKDARRVALLGKGVCFDTGGTNLKPHRHMMGMHADMAGAGAVLGAVVAAARLRLPVDVDAWLAVAENLVDAPGMRPGDVFTGHNGTSVEIVHTDAEGRLLLADGLSIVAKTKPDMVVTLATLTGSMVSAAGTHLSGLTGDPALVPQALAAGEACGERLLSFPLPDDYRKYLESKVADTLQCSAGEEPDHILAGLFLQDFTGKVPWLHMDLSASSCKGGLGAVPTEQTGFGAAWLVSWLGEVAKAR